MAEQSEGTLFLLAVLWMLLLPASLSANTGTQVNNVIQIGVMSFRSPEITRAVWQPTAEYLNQRIPSHHFTIQPMNFDHMFAAISNHKVDFVLVNSGYYVHHAAEFGLSRLATLLRSVDGQPVSDFGSVIFTRADRSDINNLQDLRHKRFLAVDKASLGGYQLTWDTFHHENLIPETDFSEILYSGLPHDNVVHRVLSGDVDAGTVRTGVLEQMDQEGRISLADLKILNRWGESDFPLIRSTLLVPEWPLVRLPHTPDKLAQQVTIELLNMAPTHPASIVGGYYGWSAPLSYRPVHQVMKRLQIGPYQPHNGFTFTDVISRYLHQIALLLLLALVLTIIAIARIIQSNRALRLEIHNHHQTETALKKNQDDLSHLAHYDPLTDLPNRLLLNLTLEQAIKRALHAKTEIGVMFLGLDRFKTINDSLGHTTGDRLLINVSNRLRLCLDKADTVARSSGDEFILILESVHNPIDLANMAQSIVATLEQPFQLNGDSVVISASIGICLYPDDGFKGEALLKHADIAMYKAKQQRKGTYVFFKEEMNTAVRSRFQLELALQTGLVNQEFYLSYQPQYDLQTNKICGAEALLRWRHPAMGLVMPDRFIPLCEETGLILDIGQWVIEEACRQCQQWLDAGLDMGVIAINVAGIQVHHGNLASIVTRSLEKAGLAAHRLEIELTESSIISDSKTAMKTFTQLRNAGVHIAIDDFGTGYSSLAYLNRLPVDKLKIDQSFVREIPHNLNDANITRTIIALAKNLGLKVIAEGIETRQQLAFLKAEGCDEGQGFRFSKPISAKQFRALLVSEKSRCSAY